MNLSSVITNILMDIGIYKVAMPFDEPIEKVLTDVIQTKTIPIFSNHHPYYETIQFDLNQLEKREKGSNYALYMLPDVFHERKILFVRSVQYADSTATGLSYYGGFPMSGGMIQQSMIANAAAKLSAKLIPRITFEWLPPRGLKIFNAINTCKINVKIAFQQDPSLGSIEDTCFESFLELATLDCEAFLYETLKHWPEINSAYGNIALKLEDWQSAKADRKQLLETWGNTSHLDQYQFEYI